MGVNPTIPYLTDAILGEILDYDERSPHPRSSLMSTQHNDRHYGQVNNQSNSSIPIHITNSYNNKTQNIDNKQDTNMLRIVRDISINIIYDDIHVLKSSPNPLDTKPQTPQAQQQISEMTVTTAYNVALLEAKQHSASAKRRHDKLVTKMSLLAGKGLLTPVQYALVMYEAEQYVRSISDELNGNNGSATNSDDVLRFGASFPFVATNTTFPQSNSVLVSRLVGNTFLPTSTTCDISVYYDANAQGGYQQVRFYLWCSRSPSAALPSGFSGSNTFSDGATEFFATEGTLSLYATEFPIITHVSVPWPQVFGPILSLENIYIHLNTVAFNTTPGASLTLVAAFNVFSEAQPSQNVIVTNPTPIPITLSGAEVAVKNGVTPFSVNVASSAPVQIMPGVLPIVVQSGAMPIEITAGATPLHTTVDNIINATITGTVSSTITGLNLTSQSFPIWTSLDHPFPGPAQEEKTIVIPINPQTEINCLFLQCENLEDPTQRESALMYYNLWNRAVDNGNDKMIAAAWNALMHALNGNIDAVKAYSPSTGTIHSVCYEKKSGKIMTAPIREPLAKKAVNYTRKEKFQIDDDSEFSISDRYIRAVGRLGAVPVECVHMTLNPSREWGLKRHFTSNDVRDDRPKPEPAVKKASTSVNTRATPEEKQASKDKLEEVVSRLIKKINTYDLALEWILTSETRVSEDLMLLLLSKLRPSQEYETPQSYLFSCMVHRRPSYERLAGLSQFDSCVSKAVEDNRFRAWMTELWPISANEIEDDDDWMRVKAGSHSREMHSLNGNIYQNRPIGGPTNKEMHAYNGNTERQDFPNTMEDINKHGGTKTLYTEKETLSGKEIANPINEVQQQSGLQNIQGVNMSAVPMEMPIRGGIVNRNNIYDPMNDLNHPEALLFPRQVRNGLAAVLINSDKRLRLYGIGMQRRMNKFGMELSSHGATISEITAKSGNIRSNQTTSFGFFTSEIVSLLKQQGDDNGDSLVSFFVKMHLYSASIAWESPSTSIPLGMEAGKFDAFTVTALVPQVTVGYNNSAIMGENCGGPLLPVFPYSFEVPRVSFHASLTTVPAGWTVFYIRGSTLQQNDTGNNAMNIALVTLGLVPYPVGLHTVSISTTDTNAGNLAQQMFIPFSACVHIPGFSRIAIILPVFGSIDPPRNQVAANSRVLVQPTSGPTAYGGLAANVLLNVNFDIDPGALISYDAAAFLGSWLALPNSPVDLTSVNRFTKQVAELCGRGKDLMFANELAVLNAVRYPPLVECVSGTPTFFGVNSEASVIHQNFFAQAPHPLLIDLPSEQGSYDFYIPELNNNFWNKTMTGCFQAISDGTVFPMKNYLMDASPRWLQYAIHIARDYAITSEYIFQYHRQSVLMWNDSFSQSNMPALMVTLRKYFACSDNKRVQNAIVQSAAGRQVAVMHWKVNGEAPSVDMWGLSIWSYINAPRVSFVGVLSIAGAVLTTPIPCVLPDVWSQLFSKKRTLAFSPFISPLKKMVGIQESGQQITALGPGAYSIPASIDSQAREVGLDSIPLIDDAEVFNARWVYHMFTASLYTLDGNIWAQSTVTSPNIVCQKPVRPDYSVPHLTFASVPSAKTNWMPYNTNNGLRLTIGVTAVNGSNLMSQIMAGRAFATLPTWVFNKITVMPNTIVGTVGNTNDGIWEDDSSEALNSSSGSSPVQLLEVEVATH